MAVSISGTTFQELYLTEQPFGYSEEDVERGFTAEKITVNGLISGAEFLTLLGIYDAWRSSRINDDDPEISEIVGATVSVSVKGPNGSVKSGEYWFSSAPSGTQAGQYVNASVEFVNASQSLEVILKQKEEEELEPDFGTYSVGGVSIRLFKPPETVTDIPSLEIGTAGIHVIKGSPVAVSALDIEGEIDANDWAGLVTWYESILNGTPGAGSLYPLSPPTCSSARAEKVGVTTTNYLTVNLQLVEVVG